MGAIGAAVARFPDTEEVTGSIPVSRTDKNPGLSGVFVYPGASVLASGSAATAPAFHIAHILQAEHHFVVGKCAIRAPAEPKATTK